VIQDPLDWLFALEHLGMKFGLENISRLVAALGHPERAFTSIHIAGTNGKGSVTAMVETAFRFGGFRAARYTSPHLERLEERFVVDGAEVTSAALRDAVATVRAAVVRLDGDGRSFAPTFFESTTAVAFELFRRRAVEVAVLEVGLGGRLDATNVVTPAVTAITSIDFDHQALLGGTLASIAAEKAGIIKPGVPLVLGPLPPEAEDVVVAVAAERGAPVIRAAGASRRLPDLRPALAGLHQRENVDVAVAVIDAMRGTGMELSDDAARAGVELVDWPGRLERLVAGNTDVLIDAAHNRAGAKALAAHLRDIRWADAALVFGAMTDKDATGMLQELSETVAAIVCTTAASPRAETAERLALIAAGIQGHPPVHAVRDPLEAFEAARALSGRVVVAGSIFLIGPLRGILR